MVANEAPLWRGGDGGVHARRVDPGRAARRASTLVTCLGSPAWTASPIVVLPRALLVVCLVWHGAAFAQDLEPRRWTHMPVGTSVGGLSYVYTDGDLSLDPVLEISNAKGGGAHRGGGLHTRVRMPGQDRAARPDRALYLGSLGRAAVRCSRLHATSRPRRSVAAPLDRSGRRPGASRQGVHGIPRRPPGPHGGRRRGGCDVPRGRVRRGTSSSTSDRTASSFARRRASFTRADRGPTS